MALAQLLAEDRVPPSTLWEEHLIASRLFEYEIMVRLHARGLGKTHAEAARRLIDSVALVELAPPVLERALALFPVPLRTLDALHLATIEFLRGQGQAIKLASYDVRLIKAARRLKIPLWAHT